MSSQIELREQLISFVKKKFYTRPNIYHLAEDIVNEAYTSLLNSKNYTLEKENFGYLSKACLSITYKIFIKQTNIASNFVYLSECSSVIGMADFVDELLKEEDTSAIIDSMEALREIEKIIVTQRYYENFTFKEIAEKNDIKLNTVLSHHRRALEKLRPILAKHFDYPQQTILEKTNTSSFLKFL